MDALMGTRVLRGVVAVLALGALVVPSAAAKGPGGGGGGGAGGGGGETTANNFSVPALFVGTNPYGLTCDGNAIEPTGEPSTGFFVLGYYYVQGINTWQAGCLEGLPAATATAAWGDNLGGDAKLKVGSPIRVEVGLLADTATSDPLTGWTVVKLDPNMLDRLSPYGTKAVGDLTSGFVSEPQTPYSETRVWAQGATLTVTKVGASTPVVNGPATAEIHATGRVVYGYNLRVSETGDYLIQYTFPNVTITGSDIGTYDGSTVTLPITVGAGGGTGGRR